MKLLFCGLGSIAKRHISNLSLFAENHDLLAFRSGFSKDTDFAEKHGIKTFTDYEKALDTGPDAVFLTNPTSFHIPMALQAAKNQCHLFIEKPVSNKLDQVDELINIVKEKQLIAMVGCNFRFHKSVMFIKELLTQNKIGRIISVKAQYGNYLPNWHPWEDYRQMYFCKENLGGGVMLDLIHEMDYIYWMLGMPDEVFSYSAKLSNLDIETEDTAEILLRYSDGKIVNIHLDCIQRIPSRNCRIIGEEGTIFWDYYQNRITVLPGETDDRRVIDHNRYDYNDMYINEIKHFISCLELKENSSIPLTEAKDVLKITLAAKESSRTGKIISLH